MNNSSPSKTTPIKQRILETTLVEVRDIKIRRRKNRITAVATTLAIAVVSTLILTQSQKKTTTDNTISSAKPDDINNAPIQTQSSSFKVNMAINGNVQTVTLSSAELTKIVFDPNFEFTETDQVYTWESKSVLIHMTLPTTSMAITDTRDDPL